MKIDIDKWLYHTNFIDIRNIKIIDDIIDKLKKKYKNLDMIINRYFLKYEKVYSKENINYLIRRLIFSYTYEFINNNKEIKDEVFFISSLKKTLMKEIPILLVNNQKYYLDSNFLFESRNIYILYLLNKFYFYINDYFQNYNNELTQNEYKLLLLNNIVRCLRSSLIMLANGDDVHGCSIMRGAIELLARYNLIDDETIGDYILFTEFNAKYQYYKSNNIKMDDYDEDMKNFIKTYNLKPGNIENFMLNGWVKNNKDKRVLSISELVKYSLSDKFLSMYKYLSEFVHEDYILVGYNYIDIRFRIKIFINLMTIGIFDEIDDILDVFDNKDKQVLKYLSE